MAQAASRKLRRVRAEDPVRRYLIAGIIVTVGLILGLVGYLVIYQDAFGDRAPRTSVERDIARYEAIVKDRPESADAWRAYSAALRAAGEPGRALDVVERGLRSTANAPVLQVERAYVLAALGKKSEALDAALKARDAEEKRIVEQMAAQAKKGIDPELMAMDQRARIEALVLIGSLRAEREEYAKAVSAYTAALESNPQLADVLAARGHAYLRSGDEAKARADFERALELDSANRSAIEGLRRATGGDAK